MYMLVSFSDGLDSPWGFRLKGGRDVEGGTPLEVVKVGRWIGWRRGIAMTFEEKSKGVFNCDVMRFEALLFCENVVEREIVFKMRKPSR